MIPLKNADGGYIAAESELDRLEGEGLVAFRYLGVNPNGSLRDIAGLTNERGNVVGLMPHPEHAVEEGFGPNTRVAMRSGVDGVPFFTSAIAAVVAPPRSPRHPPSRRLREPITRRRRALTASMSCRMRAATLTAMDAGALPSTSGMPIGVVTRGEIVVGVTELGELHPEARPLRCRADQSDRPECVAAQRLVGDREVFDVIVRHDQHVRAVGQVGQSGLGHRRVPKPHGGDRRRRAGRSTPGSPTRSGCSISARASIRCSSICCRARMRASSRPT